MNDRETGALMWGGMYCNTIVWCVFAFFVSYKREQPILGNRRASFQPSWPHLDKHDIFHHRKGKTE